jgi:hypothetical protein
VKSNRLFHSRTKKLLRISDNSGRMGRRYFPKESLKRASSIRRGPSTRSRRLPQTAARCEFHANDAAIWAANKFPDALVECAFDDHVRAPREALTGSLLTDGHFLSVAGALKSIWLLDMQSLKRGRAAKPTQRKARRLGRLIASMSD